jgi:hypothetical protein
MKVRVPRIDPKTGRPKIIKTKHARMGAMYGFAEYDFIEKGSDPERERWNDRLEELSREFIAQEKATR